MELSGTNQDTPSPAFPTVSSNTAQSTPKQIGQVIAHSATSLVLTFTDLWPEEGKWKVSHSAPGMGILPRGHISCMEFLYFKDRIIPMGALGRITRVITEYQPL